MTDKKKITKRILAFATAILLAVVIGMPMITQNNSVVARAEGEFTFGITGNDVPSGFGDPYTVKSGGWFYGSFNPDDVLTACVTFIPTQSNVPTFFSNVYSILSNYNGLFGGNGYDLVLVLSNDTEITFDYDYYNLTYTITDTNSTYIYYNGGFGVEYYAFPNGVYVSDVYATSDDGTSGQVSLVESSALLSSISDQFAQHFPVYISQAYVDNLGGGSGEGSDYNSGFNAGFSAGLTVGYQQGASSVNPEDIIENYKNSEAYRQQMEVWKNQGRLDFIASQSYRDALANAEESGRVAGRTQGFQEGLERAELGDFGALFSAVFDVPVKTITGLLNFEILGYNVKDFVLGLFSVLLVVVLIRFLIVVFSNFGN